LSPAGFFGGLFVIQAVSFNISKHLNLLGAQKAQDNSLRLLMQTQLRQVLLGCGASIFADRSFSR